MNVQGESFAGRIVAAAKARAPVVRIKAPQRWARFLVAAGAQPAAGRNVSDSASRRDVAGGSLVARVFEPQLPDLDLIRAYISKYAEESIAGGHLMAPLLGGLDNLINAIVNQWVAQLNSEFKSFLIGLLYLRGHAEAELNSERATLLAAEQSMAEAERRLAASRGWARRGAKWRYRRAAGRHAASSNRLRFAQTAVDYYADSLSNASRIRDEMLDAITAHRLELKELARLEFAKRLRDLSGTDVFFAPDDYEPSSADSDRTRDE